MTKPMKLAAALLVLVGGLTATLGACSTPFPCAELGGTFDETGECRFPDDLDAGDDASPPPTTPDATVDAATPDAGRDASALDAGSDASAEDASGHDDASADLDAAADAADASDDAAL